MNYTILPAIQDGTRSIADLTVEEYEIYQEEALDELINGTSGDSRSIVEKEVERIGREIAASDPPTSHPHPQPPPSGMTSPRINTPYGFKNMRDSNQFSPFGEIISAIMTKYNLSVVEMAKIFNISEVHLARFRKGSTWMRLEYQDILHLCLRSRSVDEIYQRLSLYHSELESGEHQLRHEAAPLHPTFQKPWIDKSPEIGSFAIDITLGEVLPSSYRSKLTNELSNSSLDILSFVTIYPQLLSDLGIPLTNKQSSLLRELLSLWESLAIDESVSADMK